jgi:carboxylesterase type B
MSSLLEALALLAVCPAVAAALAAPAVHVADGTIIGRTENSIDTFLGIPYAEPPIGSLRLKPPQPLASTLGTLNATVTPAGCPQHLGNVDPGVFALLPPETIALFTGLVQPPPFVSEDCLTLNIQRPSSTAPGSQLPVLFWIHGGGWERGSNHQYDYSRLIADSEAHGHPIMVVSTQYRLGAWGYLAGKELRDEGSTNIGLRDQRRAMEWVAENIAAFGGDPDKVTIWGESAGSMSVLEHVVVNGGDHTYRGKPLFRGAIMHSGSSTPAQAADSAIAQNIYDAFVSEAGCAGAADSLSCLRQLPFETFLNATAIIPGSLGPVGLRMNFAPRPDSTNNFYAVSPDVALKGPNPKVAPVSFISGTQDDEGTFFGLVLLNSTSSELLVDAMTGLLPVTPVDTLERLIRLYPTDPTLGSPYNTGTANEVYSQFKRNAAFIGDLYLHFPKRAFHEAVGETLPVWDFLATYNKQTPVIGTFHGSDLAVFKNQQPPTSYDAMSRYYISFINFLDPNVLQCDGSSTASLPHWPRWTKHGKEHIIFGENETTVGSEDTREEAFEYFSQIQHELLY